MRKEHYGQGRRVGPEVGGWECGSPGGRAGLEEALGQVGGGEGRGGEGGSFTPRAQAQCSARPSRAGGSGEQCGPRKPGQGWVSPESAGRQDSTPTHFSPGM